jgi:hypothetical protein
MRVKTFLHKLLSATMHLKRLATLSIFVEALIKEKKLSVSRLGRSLDNKVQEKNNIKRIDRFVSNKKLHKERLEIYKTTADYLINPLTRPIILVDWSPVPNTTHNILRASLVMKGRALSIYEEVYPDKCEGTIKAHKLFLSNLKAILPQECQPILVTDAGFRNSWFRMILKIPGWDYVGRVRGNICYQLEHQQDWAFYSDAIHKATRQGIELGKAILAKSNPILTFLYLIKLPKKSRVRLNKYKKKGNHKKDKEFSKSYNEPWLLASSLSFKDANLSLDVFQIYYKRMQIEQNFRDLKSSRFGYSFEYSYSNNIERIQSLLLIAMFATLIAYLIGVMFENQKKQYLYQANSLKNRRVLSLIYLGGQAFKKLKNIPITSILKAFHLLHGEQHF